MVTPFCVLHDWVWVTIVIDPQTYIFYKVQVQGGRWWFLTGDLEDRVILDVMDDHVWPKGIYPESFVTISSLEVCQEWGDLHGGNWRMLRVLDRRFWRQGHPWCHGQPCLTQRKIPWKFRVNIFITNVSRMGGPSWEYMEDVEGSWQVNWRTGSSSMPRVNMFDCLNQRKIAWKFCVDIFIRSMSRMGRVLHGRTLTVPDRRLGWQGVMDDLFYQKEDTLKVFCQE